MARKRSYTDEQYINAVKTSFSWAQTLKKLGLSGVGGGSYSHMKTLAKKLDVDTSHFTGQGWNVNWTFDPRKRRPLNEILVINSDYVNTDRLRQRLIKEGFKKYQCEICRRKKWNGQLIPLELHHINGIRSDHRLQNLQILCPNCHSQTSNWTSKNNNVRVSQSAEEPISKIG